MRIVGFDLKGGLAALPDRLPHSAALLTRAAAKKPAKAIPKQEK
jgi:hypothetical protein